MRGRRCTERGCHTAFAVYSRFLLLVWSLSLVAHVLRHTFDIRMLSSVLIAVVYYLFITSVLAQVFPVETGEFEQVSMNQAVVAILLHYA